MTRPQSQANNQDERVSPSEGGCWFCCKVNNWEDMRFDTEFDTNVHIACIREALEKDPEHPEANCMKYILDGEGWEPIEPRKQGELPKTKTEPSGTLVCKIVKIDGELYVKPLDWEGDEDE